MKSKIRKRRLKIVYRVISMTKKKDRFPPYRVNRANRSHKRGWRRKESQFELSRKTTRVRRWQTTKPHKKERSMPYQKKHRRGFMDESLSIPQCSRNWWGGSGRWSARGSKWLRAISARKPLWSCVETSRRTLTSLRARVGWKSFYADTPSYHPWSLRSTSTNALKWNSNPNTHKIDLNASIAILNFQSI